jgi:hypothetical protein
MNTIRKSMLLATGIFASACSFAQLGLGVQSTTQAAINSSVNTSALTKTTAATTQATKATVNATAAKTSSLAAKAGGGVNATGQKTMQAGSEVKNNANVKISSSSQDNVQAGSGSAGGNVSSSSSTNGQADVKVNANPVVTKTDKAAANLENKTSNTIQSAKKTGADIKSGATSELRSTKNAAGGANAQAEVKSETSVKAVKQ